jgi:hypothetical protein
MWDHICNSALPIFTERCTFQCARFAGSSFSFSMHANGVHVYSSKLQPQMALQQSSLWIFLGVLWVYIATWPRDQYLPYAAMMS